MICRKLLILFFLLGLPDPTSVLAQGPVKGDTAAVNSLVQEALRLRSLTEFDSALVFVDKALKQVDREGNPDQYIEILTTGSGIALDKADYRRSIKYMDQLLQTKEVKKDSARIASIWLEQSSGYLALHQYVRSMELCNRLLPVYSRQNNSDGLVRTLLLMFDNAYFSQNDSTQTDYLDMAIDIARKSGDSVLISESCLAMGKALYRKGDFSNANRFYQESRDYLREKGSPSEIFVAIFQHLCLTLMDNGLEQACELSAYILRNVQKMDEGFKYFSNAFLGRAHCFAGHGQTDSARFYLLKAEENRLKYGKAKASPGFYEEMYRVSLMIRDYDLALLYLEKAKNQFNQINQNNNTQTLANTRAEFDYTLQKEKITELKFQNQLEREKSRRRNAIILAISIILLISIMLAFFIRRQYKNLNLSYHSLVKRFAEIDELNERLNACPDTQEPKRSGSFIKDEEEILLELKRLINKERIYKDRDLNLSNLAEKLNTNTTYLSNIINNRFGMNFKSLINNKRIDEARKLLVAEEYSNFSIEGIANEVGFQSRSSFYQTFKQTTGLTPTDYIGNYKRMKILEKTHEREPVEFPVEV